jgi:serine phosphatase RsbU (regulator of sigma subunit)
MFNLYRVNKRSNRELSKRNEEIIAQKEEIEKNQVEITTKNRQITDSISYAKRIQDASLPAILTISKVFSSNLLYFRPRDIVSGDFYWYFENPEYRFMAVVDCTGHGVPGAFMSLIGANLLAETVEVQKIYSPAQVLSRMNERILQVLRQTGERKDPRDGMDMIFLAYDKKNSKVIFSGANRPLLHLRKGVLEIHKGNKYSIGGFYLEEKRFEEHELTVEKDDCLILFTDGLPDQMGGEKKRKLSTRKLTEWIQEIMAYPENEQYAELDRRMKEWQGNTRQLDDMLLWALKV